MSSIDLRRIHWAHLLLLAGLLPWLAATQGMAAEWRLGGWLALALLLLALAERLAPYRRDWVPGRAALRRDGTVLSLRLVADAVAGLLLAWSLPAQALVAVSLGELLSYSLHRASHREGWLWRVHLLHHRPSQLNLANALTAHPINVIYDKLGRLLPAVLLGLADEAILFVSLFALTQGLVAHANVAGSIGPLNWLLGSAELHRLHHSTREEEAGNFGTALPWWDLLFGTYRPAWCAPDAVGVFAPGKYPGEFALRALLAWPLRLPRGLFRCCGAGGAV
jgi:sterol desaturase/sphingolipid hydroxylase (fatty acid hydroxylase superfamily)